MEPDTGSAPQSSAKSRNNLTDHDQLRTPPSVSLPKGGGAIRGLGEKFTANPVTGTASLNVPIFSSSGRSGFGPQLELSYDSGAGNGPFGFGWNLAVPSITRKTDKGLPRYQDAEESDVFILSGAEDLVPVLVEKEGQWQLEMVPPRVVDGVAYTISRYRPRLEGLFARIERWTNRDTGETHWRSISRDNVTTVYGRTSESRIEDPDSQESGRRIFSWLICESYDDRGNAIYYQYQAEDSNGVSLSQAQEQHRTDAGRSANRYLKRILYGNKTPVEQDSDLPREFREDLSERNDWLFEVIFDYDDGHYLKLPQDPEGRELVQASLDRTPDWPIRLDSFSTYRSGFEVRTYRLCRRVLMFHHFPQELGADDYLVRSTEFAYKESPIASFITGVKQSGYVLRGEGTYLKKSLPALEFEYSEAVMQDEVIAVPPESLENLPEGLDGSRYRWIDIDGTGLSGILTEQGDAWFYKRNLSPLPVEDSEGKAHVMARFSPLVQVEERPSSSHLSEGRLQLVDLAGDGRLDLVEWEGPTPGFYERTREKTWKSFKPFSSLPNLPWQDPNLKFIDLTGDGHADILLTEDKTLTWYPSLAEQGFSAGETVQQALDEENGPRVIFNDGTQSVYLADMSGDGLTDLVRIRNGEVCYWPNLGYGRFGAKVMMDNSPCFDTPDLFDQRRIRLADIDGSGVTDILYLKEDGVHVFLNESGNGWADPARLKSYPETDSLSSVTAVDLLSNGTACLVWSSPLPDQVGSPMRYIDLMGGQKPHLLIKMVNNLGAETRVHYAPSTKFYLADKEAGRPWVTRLSFPVHVVERVETYDHISRNRFVSRYAYHHGYFDGAEREFRGFGMVEQWDTEEYAALSQSQSFPGGDNVDEASHVPPVMTRTWFHTGAYLGREHVSDFYAGLLDADDIGEYYREPGITDEQARELLLKDTVLPEGLSVEEEREACRALKGSMLRQEVYGRDGSGKEPHPYTVTEQNLTIRCLQRRSGNRHAVFFTHARETVNYHYDRNPADPRISHMMTLEVDVFGNVLKQAAIHYGRRQTIRIVDEQKEVQEIANPGLSLLAKEDQEKQTRTLITYVVNRVTNGIEAEGDYQTPLPCETRTYELTGYTPTGRGGRFLPSDFVEPHPNEPDLLIELFDKELSYEEEPSTGRQRRLIEHVRTLYRPDDLGSSRNDPVRLLPLGAIEPLALPGEVFKLAFTPGLLEQTYQRALEGQLPKSLMPDPHSVLTVEVPGEEQSDRGGYVNSLVLRNQHLFPSDSTHSFWTKSDTDGHWWIPSTRLFYSPGQSDSAVQELTHARQHFFLPHRFRDPFGQTSTVLYDSFNLLLLETRDPLDNRVTAGERNAAGQIISLMNDYRVLEPSLITNSNGNRSAVLFDALGMVVGTAAMGKPGEDLGDSLNGFETDLTRAIVDDHLANPLSNPHAILGRASTRLVYNLATLPALVYTLARETHDTDLEPGQKTKIQHSFSYSDGFGREIQKKLQAEPGPVPKRDTMGAIILGTDGRPEMTDNAVAPRWVGSGWTILNNKDKPVRRYEPFFTDTHHFEFDVRIGVSPVLFYDPAERLMATLHPNHTWEKVVFDPWRQENWDRNDTALIDPVTDADTGDFFKRLQKEEYWPTWHSLRTDPAHDALADHHWPDPRTQAAEKHAAEKASVHAATPTVSHADSLGRVFLTVEHNRFKYNTTSPEDSPVEEFHETRYTLDIDGNQRETVDAKDRVVLRYDYDMLGDLIYRASMEAGGRWMLNDVTGKSIRTWNSRGQEFRTSYDPLRRPLGLYLIGDSGAVLLERTVYGESWVNSEAKNLRGEAVQLFDQAGVLSTDDYDFKGNLLASKRQLAEEYQATLDWEGNVPLEAAAYIDRTRYDALNRPIQLIAPHSDQPGTQINVLQSVYNEANLLERVNIWLNQTAEPTDLLDISSANLEAVTNVEYDAKGQRTLIEYGNGVKTRYEINPVTSRLERLITTRNKADFPGDCPPLPAADWAGCDVQNLYYTYDATGNITHIRDDAQQTVYFKNRRVEPSGDYTYDSLYRLIEATGRQHLGQTGAPITHSYNNAPRVRLQHPGDGQAMGTYRERYIYDSVGNILEVQHRGSNPLHPGWTRNYAYNESSPFQTGQQNNRLTSTTVGNNPEIYSVNGDGYDPHGNMLKMPQLHTIEWDCKDQLRMSQRQAVNLDDVEGQARQGERTYYVYDAAGQRVRKTTELENGTLKEERIYLGGFEIFQQHTGTNAGLVRETLQVMDDKNLIALVETRTQGDDPGPVQLIRYQFGNHLGSANLELDHQAQIISYEEYTPFGSTSYQAVRSQTETPKRYRYTGKERDEESGLYYHGARYYAPWLGRWTAADPVWHPGSSYNYAENNPVLLSDPTGRDVPLYADFGGEHVHGQGMLRSGQIGTGNARLRMHPNGNYYLAEGYTPDVRNPLERAIVNYELTGDESFLDEVDAKMKGSGTSDTWRALSWNAAARHAGKDIRTDGQWWAVVGGAVLLMMGVAMTSRAGSSMRPAMSKEERIAAQHRQAVASRKAEAARRAKAEFQRKAKAYREAVFKTGEPSTVEPRVHRAGERPYTIPKDMQVAGPGRRVDVGKLDTSKKYLWVVTKSGEVRIAAESQPGLGRPLKHGDLVPGPGGQYRGHARAGGELYFDQSQGVWVMNNDSSFTFARAAGKWTPGSNPNAPWTSGQKGTVVSPWSSAESLQASKQLLQMTGTDTSKIVTQDVLAAQR